MANSNPTSSEENTPNHRVRQLPIKKKKGAIHSLMDLKMKRTRPISWHGRGQVDFTIQSKPIENENPFTNEDSDYHHHIFKAFSKRNESSVKSSEESIGTIAKERDMKTESIMKSECPTRRCNKTNRTRPRSWIGESQRPKPYAANEPITSPSLIGKSMVKHFRNAYIIHPTRNQVEAEFLANL